ncbi:MAG: hypothetical protein JWM48_914 [Mycobacterium sp.]|jgi:hypothetical protein|nr:hypothetical protein [Mycobacterium sp.]
MPDVMDLLRDGVPLSLLIDVLGHEAPDSASLYAEEGAPAPWWLPRGASQAG